MRSIPTVTKNLLIINVIAFIAMLVMDGRGIDLNNIFGLHFFMASDFHLYQFFTYMFMHGGWEHIFFNMFALWMFGCVVENVWGPKKFLFYYILCGIGAGVVQEIAQLVSLCMTYHLSLGDVFSLRQDLAIALNGWTTVGASGAIYAILLAFGMIFPNERIFIFPLPIPIKAKWLVMFYVVVELFSAMGSGGNDNVAHFAHLGGMLFGFILIRYWTKHPEVGSGYGRNKGQQFFDRMRNSWENRSHRSAGPASGSRQAQQQSPRRETDQQYNARKKREQDEIDIILDKIRKSGYDSLTKEEKQKLFDAGRRK